MLPNARDILTELDRLRTAQTTDKSMDQPIGPAYDQILKAIRNQPKICEWRAIRTLACLVPTQRILTIKELQIVVSLKADMTKLDTLDLPAEEKLIDFCFGLVVKDDVTKTVRLAHFSAQEYLNQKGIIPHDSEPTLAIACITYLSFDEFKKHDCLSFNGCTIRCDTHNFFKYAVANLSFQLNSSDQEGIVKEFRKFLDSEGNVLTYYNALRKHSRLVRAPAKRISQLDASAIGHAMIVKYLLESGCHMSITNQDLLTPLHLASHIRHLSLVIRLLEQGANLHTVDKWKDTPLHFAAECGPTEVARLLLDSGANSSLANDVMSTPLHCAARLGYLNLVKLLLEKNVDPIALEKWKTAPLHFAASREHTEAARVDSDAEATLATDYMDISFRRGAELGNLDLVKQLLDGGADPNSVMLAKGITPHSIVLLVEDIPG
jgi:ankyrin repeat protein